MIFLNEKLVTKADNFNIRYGEMFYTINYIDENKTIETNDFATGIIPILLDTSGNVKNGPLLTIKYDYINKRLINNYVVFQDNLENIEYNNVKIDKLNEKKNVGKDDLGNSYDNIKTISINNNISNNVIYKINTLKNSNNKMLWDLGIE